MAPDGALVTTAEEYAAGMIRRCLDSAVRPNLQEIADETALTVREVEEIRDRMLSGKRGTQTLGRPRAAPPPLHSGTDATSPAGPAEALDWQTARDHPSAKVRDAYGRAVAAIVRVESLLAEDAAKARLRDREAKLAAELAKVRAELKGAPGKPRPRSRRRGVPVPPLPARVPLPAGPVPAPAPDPRGVQVTATNSPGVAAERRLTAHDDRRPGGLTPREQVDSLLTQALLAEDASFDAYEAEEWAEGDRLKVAYDVLVGMADEVVTAVAS